MTLKEAKTILQEYRLPLTKEKLEEFKQALKVVSSAPFTVETE